MRTRNFSDSAFIVGLSGLANVSRTRSARVRVPVLPSGSCMLRESSIRMPTTFCCATAALTMSTGRKMQKRMMPSAATRSAAERGALPPLDARLQHAVADERNRQRGDDDHGGQRRAGRRGKAKITLTEDVGPVLEEELE